MSKTTVDKKPAFLRAFIETTSITAAAKACRIDRSVHYDWIEQDPEYAKAFERARVEAAQVLEDDIAHWARIGVFEPLVYQGGFCFKEREVKLHTLADGREVREDQLPEDRDGIEIASTRTITEKYGPPLGIHRRSEGLMKALAKAWMPERYGDRTEVTGRNGGAIETALTVTFVKPE